MMSVAGGWKRVCQGSGCAANAAGLIMETAAAPAPAKNFVIAFIVSRFHARRAKNSSPHGGNPVGGVAGSNHTLYPTARKERQNPCGIFAREEPVRPCRFAAFQVLSWPVSSLRRKGRNSGG